MIQDSEKVSVKEKKMNTFLRIFEWRYKPNSGIPLAACWTEII